MPAEAITTIDDYEVFLTERMTNWSPQQRLALAAALAERWLPAYESFSAEEEWGDAASLRRSLDAVWGQVQGRNLADRDVARHIAQLEEVTPHMDDFDAEDALAACGVLHDALRACRDPANSTPYVLGSVLGVLESLVGEWPVDPTAQRRAWQKAPVRKELQAHWKLVDEINQVTAFDAETVKALRARIDGLKRKLSSRPKPQGPARLTNQAAFEQYRRYVESDIKGQVTGQPEPAGGSYLFAFTYLGYWLARYSRRMQIINGSYGLLADQQGQRALIAWNRVRDASEKGTLDWDSEVHEAIEMCLANNSRMNVVDAGSVEAPHSYGPSLRRLWLEGRRLGQRAQDGWKHIRTWASHRPTVWEAEDRRKKKGIVFSMPELGERLARELLWKSTNDSLLPWTCEVEGTIWQIRINDFPDELLYSLLIDGATAGDFHDWPETWQRPL